MATGLARSDRWAPYTGGVFVVLLVLGILLLGTPEGDAPDEEWLAHFSDSGNRTQAIVATYLTVVAGLSFLCFTVGLSRRIERPDEPGLARLALGAGTVYAALVAVAGVVGGLPALAHSVGGMPLIEDADLIRMTDALYFAILLIPGLLTAGVFAAAACRGAALAFALPRWVIISGYVVAVLAVAGALAFPMALWLAWVLVASVALVVRDVRHGPNRRRFIRR